MDSGFTDRLIDLIYAAMLGEASWQRFVRELGAGLPDGRATLFFHDPSQGSGKFMVTSGMDAGDVRAYDETYAKLNPWMPGAARRPVGLGVVAEQMLDPAVFRQSILYNDFLRPLNVKTATGITVERSEGRLFLLSVLTSRADPEANMDHAQAMTRICPHLRRAFRYIRQRDVLGIEGRAALDALGVGVVIVGSGGACRHVSPLASSLMQKSRAFAVDRGNKLRTTNPALSAALQAMLQVEASETRTREVLLLDHGMALRALLVRIATDEMANLLTGPTLIVLLDPLTGTHQGTRANLTALDGIAALHKLSRAETEILQAIVSGLTVDQIARLRGVTRETVRGQIKSLFAKTGAHRQAELMRLVLAPYPPEH